MRVPVHILTVPPPWTMGVRMLPWASHGLMGLGDSSTESLALANINRDYQSYINGLNYSVEQGQVVSPAMMQQGLIDRVTGVCTDVLTAGAGCDPNTFLPQIQQLSQQYAAALQDQQQKTAALVAAGAIAVPAGYYGGQNLYDPNYKPPSQGGAPVTPPPTITSIAVPPPAPPLAAPPTASSVPAVLVSPAPTGTSTVAPAPSTSSTSQSKPSVMSSTAVMDWLKGSMFGGVPNWALVAVAAGGAFYFMGSRRR